MPAFTAISPQALFDLIAERIIARPGPAVVAIDGADAAAPEHFAASVAERLRTAGRSGAVVSLHDFVRPASLRLEFGRDELSYRTAWFDYQGLDREVLQALRRHGHWLPALWNEAGDRSARAAKVSASDRTVILVAGPMLLGRGLDFDLAVELRLSEAALRRGTAADQQFTVDALLRHHHEHSAQPDLLIAWDHRDRPALRS